MSKRAKFTLITWVGDKVSGLQRAKISTDKTLVKDIVQVIYVFIAAGIISPSSPTTFFPHNAFVFVNGLPYVGFSYTYG